MKYEIVVVGTSWGGLNALSVMLDGLPPDFPLPMAIVQHRGKEAKDLMAQLLQQRTTLDDHKPKRAPAGLFGRRALEPRGELAQRVGQFR